MEIHATSLKAQFWGKCKGIRVNSMEPCTHTHTQREEKAIDVIIWENSSIKNEVF